MLEQQIRSLVGGQLGQEESLACLRALTTNTEATGAPSNLDPGIFKMTIETVRESAPPELASLFVDAGTLIDCCGTGGSGLSHFNTSTTVAFVLAAAGLKVAKFGNRAASGRSGSFDLLDALGIGATISGGALAAILNETGLVFLFAPQFYPALTGLAPLRKQVGQPTVFNLIGPLLNPARPRHRLIGVPTVNAQNLVAEYLQSTGEIDHALVVNASSGLDELDVHCQNHIARVHSTGANGSGSSLRISRETYEPATLFGAGQLTGKKEAGLSVPDSLEIFNKLMAGELSADNYYHALVCLNAGAAMNSAGAATSLEDGYSLASGLLKDGSVREKVRQYQNKFREHK